MNNIKLGQTVRDVASGFKGLAVQRIDQLNGNVQWALQPKVGEDGVFKDALQMDNHMLEVIDDGLADKVTAVTDTVDFVLGNEVKDLATGFVGIAIEKATYMNGCVSYWVVPKHDPKSIVKDSAPSGTWLSSKRLVYKGAGIAEKVRKPTADPYNGRIPGGPPARVARPMVRGR